MIMSYSITLKNGKKLSGLNISGTCFVSSAAVSEEFFDGFGGRFTLSYSGEAEKFCAPYPEGEVVNVNLGRIFQLEGKYYFYFEQMSSEQVALMQLQADIEYVAMMSEVEL